MRILWYIKTKATEVYNRWFKCRVSWSDDFRITVDLPTNNKFCQMYDLNYVKKVTILTKIYYWRKWRMHRYNPYVQPLSASLTLLQGKLQLYQLHRSESKTGFLGINIIKTSTELIMDRKHKAILTVIGYQAHYSKPSKRRVFSSYLTFNRCYQQRMKIFRIWNSLLFVSQSTRASLTFEPDISLAPNVMHTR